MKEQQLLRALPAVNQLISNKEVEALAKKHQLSNRLLVAETQTHLQIIRQQILADQWEGAHEVTSFQEEVLAGLLLRLQQWLQNSLHPVINATGVVLHTNLGRAVLSEEAIQHVCDVASHYSTLEYEIEDGVRGSRHVHVEELLTRLTQAEAAMVVNNNAAAVYLVLRELAREKEVVISRGELVEIGGSFRISSIMEESGAQLVEVGTTNKTKLSDYEGAIHPETAMLLKVHTSNFRIVGFTQVVEREELVQLGHAHGIPVVEDLGSGVMFPFHEHHIGDEPLVQEVLAAGVDLVTFSGDKLLGGPQAGIIAGKKALIQRLKKNQLARVLRVDKMTLAALETTLRHYLNQEYDKIPTLRDVLHTTEEIREKAVRCYDLLSPEVQEVTSLCEIQSQVGGGTLPLVTLPSVGIAVAPTRCALHHLERALRQQPPHLIGRIENEQLILDFRTIQEAELPLVAEHLNHSYSSLQ